MQFDEVEKISAKSPTVQIMSIYIERGCIYMDAIYDGFNEQLRKRYAKLTDSAESLLVMNCPTETPSDWLIQYPLKSGLALGISIFEWLCEYQMLSFTNVLLRTFLVQFLSLS